MTDYFGGCFSYMPSGIRVFSLLNGVKLDFDCHLSFREGGIHIVCGWSFIGVGVTEFFDVVVVEWVVVVVSVGHCCVFRKGYFRVVVLIRVNGRFVVCRIFWVRGRFVCGW